MFLGVTVVKLLELQDGSPTVFMGSVGMSALLKMTIKIYRLLPFRSSIMKTYL